MHLGLDIGSRLTGYAVGDGSVRPEVGAWPFERVETAPELGKLGIALTSRLSDLHSRSKFTRITAEAPILVVGYTDPKTGQRRTDDLWKLRRLYGMLFAVATWAEARGIAYSEENVRTVKKELAGTSKAEKADMVAAAQKVGIVLPKTKVAGMEDAADAFAVWLLGLRKFGNQNLSRDWDRRLYSSRGLLT